ncbi:MAG: ImmA/IrrE family metallo-endopeptidase [Parvibaculum sp.]|nr:ImmA/IrrE family metallo-endopeptidase [Parvibaculum sp.]
MRPAEALLSDLGISDPCDIDLRAIAHCVGVEVIFRNLAGCEAQIVGVKDRAIVFVSEDARHTRKRFSTGHELGHWHHHRGQSFVCRKEDIGRPVDNRSNNAERVADAYAADLILPPFMLRPRIALANLGSLELISEIATQFAASLTATALRFVKMTEQPVILMAHNLAGRKWQWASVAAGQLRVRDDIDSRSCAFSAAKAGHIQSARREPAHYWFDRRHIEQFDLKVQSVQTIEGELLTLIGIPDKRLVELYG